VSQRLRDGDPSLVAVQPLQQLRFGVELVEGEIIFQLTQDQSWQPIYQELINFETYYAAPWGIEGARLLHHQLIPVVLGGGLFALALGQFNVAASLMQFDPFRDWQVSASVAYRGASQLLASWGVVLRKGRVLDRLAECRTLVIAEGAICHAKNRSLQEIRILSLNFDVESLLQIAAGFHQSGQNGAILLDPIRAILLAKGLQPRCIEVVQPVNGCGMQGVCLGQQVCIGGGSLLSQLGIPRPASMPKMLEMHWLFVLVDGDVVGGFLFQEKPDPRVKRSLRWLRRNGWDLHLVSNNFGDTMEGLVCTLELSPDCIHTCQDLTERRELLRCFDRLNGPVAYLGSSLTDAGALAAADIALAMADGSLALSSELADIVLPTSRIDRLVDCVAVAADIGSNNRQNFYLVLLPHSVAFLLGLLLLFDPLLAVLLTDVPLVLIELHNLRTHHHLLQRHRLGWRALRKRRSKYSASKLPVVAG
jgi:Cu2+-exporting ATPase